MKKYFFFIAASIMMGGCDHSHTTNATGQVNGHPIYGETFDPAGKVAVDSAFIALGTNDSLDMKISGKILASCTGEGCWLEMTLPNGEAMLVKTEDKFFIPTSGVQGLTAVVNGKAFKKEAERTDEQIAANTPAKETIKFIAKGIMIENYKPTDEHMDAKGGEHDHSHEECKSHDHKEGESH